MYVDYNFIRIEQISKNGYIETKRFARDERTIINSSLCGRVFTLNNCSLKSR